MRILILEDDLERMDTFNRLLKGHRIVHVSTVFDAIQAFKREPRFDVVFLDHDLNDVVPNMYGYDERTGKHVAIFMVKYLMPDKKPKKVVVHSMNDEGARGIMSILNSGEFQPRRVPFTEIVPYLKSELL